MLAVIHYMVIITDLREFNFIKNYTKVTNLFHRYVFKTALTSCQFMELVYQSVYRLKIFLSSVYT